MACSSNLSAGRHAPWLVQGNQDDHFKLGLKITRASLRLYTDFYGSDIVVASPLALVTRLEANTGGPQVCAPLGRSPPFSLKTVPLEISRRAT